jgi:16S rRNA (cytosine1402-N4)-methyltransferase
MTSKKNIKDSESQSAPPSINESNYNYHVPVLFQETIELLNIKPDGTYVDCTFGGGGHSRAILEKLNDQGRLLAFDQDEDAARNLPADDRVIFVPHNFRHLSRFCRLHKVDKIDGLLADIGVSSYQFDEASRGFSTRFEAALDMRMDQRGGKTAADIIATYSEKDLQRIFEQYGEVTNAKTLARTITDARQLSPIKTINEFKSAVHAAVKGNPNKYFAQVFQALRIEVNEELEALKEMLQQLPPLLRTGGRVAIISFHSLEDRMVKTFFKRGTFEEDDVYDVYGKKSESPFRIITKKPVEAGAEEMRRNPRSRSAKLRVAEMK